MRRCALSGQKVRPATTQPASAFANAPDDAEGDVDVNLPYSGWYRVTESGAERAPVVDASVPVGG